MDYNADVEDLSEALKCIMGYMASNGTRLHYLGNKCYVNLSSCHITSAALRNRMVLETAGTLRKHSKSELEKNGIHINQGFDGRYCFWEMDSETINRYVTSLKSQVK
ncbi:MAG TPA: hypothetical protein VJI12_02150 [archaeon]|nr:hypothetical protein [archaeon]